MNLSTLSKSNTGMTAVNRVPVSKMLKPLMGLLLLMMFSSLSSGQLLLTDNFTGLTAGNLAGQSSWTKTGSGPDATIASVSPLTLSAYNGGGAEYVQMPTATSTTSNVRKGFTATAAGTNTIYYSFLLNLSAATAGGDYFLSLADPSAGTSYFARVFAKTSGAGYNVGIAKSSATGTYGTTVYNLNQTYLVVVRFTFVTGATNDAAYIWMNPSMAFEPTTVSAEAQIATGADPGLTGSQFGNIVWHNRSTSNPVGKFDGLRVAYAATSAAAWTNLAISTVNGTIASGEYGTHTNGQNQQSSATGTWYMNWDDTYLFVGLTGTNTAEGAVLYLDKIPTVPVNGGTNSDGTNVGYNNYDGSNFAALQFRADMVVYFKDTYREYRTADGANGWSSPTAAFGIYSSASGTKEIAIPWSAIGGRPASFNWFGYVAYAGGGAYASVPTENPGSGAGLIIGASARWERYYTVSTTTIGSSTAPFSRNSFVFNNTADETSFGAISVYDFTMNSSGRFISRTGATNQNWSVAGNMVVGDGTIYMGSGGTNGAYGSTTITGDFDIRGGTLDMDQTTSPVTVNGNLPLSAGTLKLSANVFGGGDLILKGNWNNTGGTFTPQTRAVFLNAATGNQTITKAGGETFDYVIVDKAAGSVVLAGNMILNQTLTLTNGTINTAANKVQLNNNAPGSLARTNGYVNGNLQRAIATGTNTYDFAVGTAAGYTPASFAFTGISGAGTILIASNDGVGANYPAALNATKRLARNWTSVNTGVTGIGGTATFTYLGADLVGGAVSGNLKAYVNNGSTTYSIPTGTTGSSFTFNSLTTVGEFGAGECSTSLAPTFTKTMASSCGGGADGSITVTPVGGVSPYTYSWTSNPSGFTAATAAITGLAPKDYTVVVTDALSCTASIPNITIWQALAPTITHSGSGSGSCGNTGSIILYAGNGVAPYTYSIDGTNYFAGNTFINVAGGTYTGYVKDLRNCISTRPNIVVTSAAAIVVTANTRAASSCANNGVIELYRTGGVAPYTYSLDDVTYQGSNTFSNLAGNATYTGWVKDSKGCKTSLPNITVAKATTVTATATHTNASACANDGTITLTGNGGVPGFTYSITGAGGPYQAGATFTGLAAGSYTGWVQDSKGCKNFVGVTITGTAGMTVTAQAYDAGGCNNAGKIKLFVTGGVGPYTYSLDNVGYVAGNTFTGLTAGMYTGYVKDSKGCVVSLPGINVTQNTTALTTTESHTQSSTCVNDGTIQLRPAGGVQPWTYSLDNITYQAGAYFTGLAPAAYTGWVKDANGCTASVSLSITANPIIITDYVTDPTNCATANGKIQLFRTGGTGPYTYSLDNITYQASNTFTGLLAGTYTCYVKDSKGCVGSVSVEVGPGCPPGIAANRGTGAAKVAVSNGFTVQAYPNPTATEFTLKLEGNSNAKVSITVTDLMGRNVLKIESAAGKLIRFGNELNAGVYLVQVVQAGEKRSIKLVKE